MSYTEDMLVFPEDVQFGRATEKLYSAGEGLGARPLNFSRMGGSAIGRAGDMYGSFYGAANRAKQQLDLSQANRQLADELERRRRRAMIEGMRSKIASDLFTSGCGIASDYIASRRLKDRQLASDPEEAT